MLPWALGARRKFVSWLHPGKAQAAHRFDGITSHLSCLWEPTCREKCVLITLVEVFLC